MYWESLGVSYYHLTTHLKYPWRKWSIAHLYPNYKLQLCDIKNKIFKNGTIVNLCWREFTSGCINCLCCLALFSTLWTFSTLWVISILGDKEVPRLHVHQARLGAVTTEVAVKRDASIPCPESELEANSTPLQKRLFLAVCPRLSLSLLHWLQLLSGKKAPPSLFNNIWKCLLKKGEEMQVLHIRKNTRKNPKLIQGHFMKCRALRKFLSTWTRQNTEGQISV